MAEQHRTLAAVNGGRRGPSQPENNPPPYQVSFPTGGISDASSRLDVFPEHTISSSLSDHPLPRSWGSSNPTPAVAPDDHDDPDPISSHRSARPSSRRTEHRDLEDVYIAIMGVTGAGKSKFIELCTQQNVKVGHGLVSCTLEVNEYQFVYRDKRVHLIDTPGFDDTNRSDREVLDDIARWMGTAYSQDIKLSGIIYLQRITDTRFGGTASRNLVMFKKLCGEECFKRVLLATTMWDLVDEAVGEAREKELTRTEHFWGQMIARGSMVDRHYGDRDSAMDILKYILKHGKKDVLRVQKEMVDGKLTLDETSAGREVSREIIEQRKKYDEEIKRLQADKEELIKMNEVKAAEQLAKQQKEYENKIRKGYEDQEKLRATLEQLQEQKAAELRDMQEQLEEAREAFRAQVEDLERIKIELQRAEPDSSYALTLRRQMSTQKEEIEEVQRNLDQQEANIIEKQRNFFIRAYEWAKNHPQVIAHIAMVGVKALSTIVRAA